MVSKKDQEQYWAVPESPYRYIPVVKFAEAFRSFHAGKILSEELNVPFDRRYNHPAALSASSYGVRRRELLTTSFNWQLLLMKRNSFIYVFKFVQVRLAYPFWLNSLSSHPHHCPLYSMWVTQVENSREQYLYENQFVWKSIETWTNCILFLPY